MVAFFRAAQRIGIAGGLGIVLLSGFGYNLLLTSLPNQRGNLALKMAALAAMLLFCLGWAILMGATARRRNWSSDGCFRFAALSLMVLGPANLLVLSQFVPVRFGPYTVFLAIGPSVGAMARKIAFPELKFGHAPSPLTTLRLN